MDREILDHIKAPSHSATAPDVKKWCETTNSLLLQFLLAEKGELIQGLDALIKAAHGKERELFEKLKPPRDANFKANREYSPKGRSSLTGATALDSLHRKLVLINTSIEEALAKSFKLLKKYP